MQKNKNKKMNLSAKFLHAKAVTAVIFGLY